MMKMVVRRLCEIMLTPVINWGMPLIGRTQVNSINKMHTTWSQDKMIMMKKFNKLNRDIMDDGKTMTIGKLHRDVVLLILSSNYYYYKLPY